MDRPLFVILSGPGHVLLMFEFSVCVVACLLASSFNKPPFLVPKNKYKRKVLLNI